MGFYHTAQICLNGHIITKEFDSNSDFVQAFCDDCGAATITKCPSCNSPIHGEYEFDPSPVAFLGSNMNKVPAYCYNCGKPYPWTKAALDSAKTLIEEDENLTSSEKQQFSETLPDLMVESPTPKTQVSVVRFKRFIKKSASYTADGIKDIFVEVASETIKKSLGL